MENRYLRNIPALSQAECALLRQKKVAVIGCGGLGGYLIEFLARVGIGSIRAVDGDVFDETNLNRQLLSTVSLLGKSKARAAAARVGKIAPDVKPEAVETYLDSANVQDLIAGCDAVLDGLDNVPARKTLAKACAEAGIPYIYGAISGWTAQAAVFMPGDHLLETLYPDGVEARDWGALSFTPALCAAFQTSLCVRLLTGRPLETGKLHCADLLGEEYQQILLK